MIESDLDLSDIRIITEKELPEFLKIFCEAYPGMRKFSQADREKLGERLQKAGDDKRITNYGIYRENSMVGVLRLFDFSMNLFGQRVLCGGIGGIGVDLIHKKEKVAKEIMEFFLEHYREKNAPILALWPFRPDFYRNMGFGYGGRMYQYYVCPKDFPANGDYSKVRYLSIDDAPSVTDCYNQYVSGRTGMFEEEVVRWKIRFEIGEEIRVVGYENNGRIDGYLMYTFTSARSDNFLLNDINVTEAIFNTREARLGLLTFLHRQFDQIHRVRFITPEENFYFQLIDPRNGSENVFHSVNHESHLGGVGIMYRILDLPLTLNALSGHNFNNASLVLGIDLADSFYPANNRLWTIEFENGRATLNDKAKPDVTIKIDIAEFSSMFLGAVSFRELYDMSLAEISNDDQVDKVSAIFACSQRPVCFTPF